MKARTVFLVCLAITVGALYGRYRFLHKRGFLDPEVSFIQALPRVIGFSKAPQPPERPEPEAAEPPAESKAPPKEAPSKPAERQTKPESEPSQPARPAADAEAVLRQARSELRKGRIESSIAVAAQLGTPEAARLEREARLLRSMVADVDVDPGAGRKRITEVTLKNKNVLYAVDAETAGGTLNLRLADGIKCGLPEDTVESWREIDARPFHEERLKLLRERLRSLGQGGVFERWKAIRLAWRRGFPVEAYRVYEELADTPKAVEALVAVVPGADELLASFSPPASTAAEPVEVAMASSPPGETGEPPAPSAQPPTPVPTDPADSAAFADVDAAIRQAQGKIHAALSEEGAAADELIREAGKLLVAARNELTGNSSLPRGEAYQARLHKVTLILDDFLKMSSFGINRGRR